MSPVLGSLHRRARRDSGAARLWMWARARRGPWTCPEAADACDISPRRCRLIVAALHTAGLLEQTREPELGDAGMQSAEWRLSAAGRAMTAPPIRITDATTGAITGIRAAGDGTGAEALREAVARSGLSIRRAAAKLGLDPSTLHRWLRTGHPIAADDPVIARALKLTAPSSRTASRASET